MKVAITFTRTIAAIMLLGLLPVMAMAAGKVYQTPTDALAKLVDQPSASHIRISDNHQWMLELKRASNPSIADVAQKEMRLAGLRISPALLAPSRIRSEYVSLSLISLQTYKTKTIEGLPEGSFISVQFSPDSQFISFVNKAETGLYLYLYDIQKQSLRKLLKKRINGIIGADYVWLNDNSGLLTRIEPKGAKAPIESFVPTGPVIQESMGNKAPVRTYQDLLKNTDDEQWFDYLTTTQLISVSTKGRILSLGKPGVISDYSVSPDNQHMLVEQLQRPYSYSVPYYRFAQRADVWDRKGRFVKNIAKLDLAENLPKGFDSVRTGRRSIDWRADKAATLVWAEALDGGDMKRKQPLHDQVYIWSAPFKEEPQKYFATERRYRGIAWGQKNLALYYEWRFSDRKLRVWKFDSENPVNKVLWQDRSRSDVYNDPGSPVYTQSQYGTRLIKVKGESTVYLRGNGASPKGNIPFLNEYNFGTGASKQLWHSNAPYYERVVSVLDDKAQRLLISRESVTEPRNYFLHKRATNKNTALTHVPHPTPEFIGIRKEMLKYKRDDGIELSGMLYLPVGYKPEQGKLPVLMWAYPREYKNAKVAGQVRTSPYAFKPVSYWGPLPFLAKGYAIFDGPTMPIVGKGDRQPNDSYRQQLVKSAEAAIKVLVDKGIADPKRIAIGGHSYGAFMVGNLLAHSDLFATGIARSGAYNRSLTPFGFQGEERDFWEGQDVYAVMSPFYHAEKINEPMLMIHGEADNNSGTFPIQSKRMFAAVKGLGGKVRLVMLAHESHRYTARESLLHMLWEEEQWLKRWVGQ